MRRRCIVTLTEILCEQIWRKYRKMAFQTKKDCPTSVLYKQFWRIDFSLKNKPCTGWWKEAMKPDKTNQH